MEPPEARLIGLAMKTNSNGLAFRLSAFLATLIALAFLWESPFVLAALVVAMFIICDRLWHAPNDYALYALGAFLGTVTEIILISRGAWSYAQPTAFGVPIWLPFTWGFAIVLIVKLAEAVAGPRKP